MKLQLLSLVLFISSISLYSQNGCKISGQLKDIHNTPLPGATIKLLNIPDSTTIVGTLTDSVGFFSITSPVTTSILEIRLLGFKTTYKSLKINTKLSNYSIGELFLEEKTINLKEVSILGNTPAIVTKGDTLEYNATIYSLPEYATVKDLLKVLPNVSISSTGIITVQGKEVKKILVDGREFFSGDTELATRALPSKVVSKVQVIDKTSTSAQLTGFDNEQKETVINLEVKEKMKTALMANASAGLGSDIDKKKTRYENYAFINIMKTKSNFTIFMQNNNTNNGLEGTTDGFQKSNQIGLNMSKDYSDKLKVYSDIIYDSNETYTDNITNSQTILSSDKLLHDNNHKLNTNNSKSLTINSNMSWNPNERNALFIKGDGVFNNSKTHYAEKFESLNNLLDTLYNGNSAIYSKGYNYNWEITTDYAYNFKKKGRVLSSSFTIGTANNDNKGMSAWEQRLFDNNSFRKDSVTNQHNKNKNHNNNLQFTLSYVEPVNKNHLIQLIYKIQCSSFHQDQRTYDIRNQSLEEYTESLNRLQSINSIQKNTNQWFTLNLKSTFKKATYIIGANIILNKSNNKSYQPYSNLSGDSIVSAISHNTTLYSPTLDFNYTFNENKKLNINYQGLMTPSSPTQTQDYINTSNPTNHIKGNPQLKPQFRNSMVASFKGSNSKRQLYYNFSISGKVIMNEIRPVTILNTDNGERTTTYKNVNGNWNIGMSSIINLPLKNHKFKFGNSFLMEVGKRKGIFNFSNRNIIKTIIEEKPYIKYNIEGFDITLNGILTYINAKSNVQDYNKIKTFDWGGSLLISYQLPYNFRIGAALYQTNKSGYSKGYNYSETILNGNVTKKVFTSSKLGEGTVSFAMYDILRNRRNTSLIIGDNSFQNNISSTLGCYFIGSFIYNFNFFPNDK